MRYLSPTKYVRMDQSRETNCDNLPDFLAHIFGIHLCPCMDVHHSHEMVSAARQNPLSV